MKQRALAGRDGANGMALPKRMYPACYSGLRPLPAAEVRISVENIAVKSTFKNDVLVSKGHHIRFLKKLG